jgi:hypothetical protein
MKIQEFPLAWRWTDSRHSLLPETILSQLHPLESPDAHRSFERAQAFQSDGECSQIIHSAEVSDEEGRAWLRQQHGCLDDIVTIAWSPDCVLRTSWEIFTDYWSDFCYPSSDDMAVWPESERWVLFYDHEEQFAFARRSAA